MADQKNSFGKVIGCFFYFFFLLFFILMIVPSVFFNFRILAPGFSSFIGVLFILFMFFVVYSIAARAKKRAGNNKNNSTESAQKSQQNIENDANQKTEKTYVQGEQQDYSDKLDEYEAFEGTYEKDRESNGPKSEDVYKAFLLLKLNPNSTYTQVSERYYELTKKVHQKKISEKDKQRELDELEKAYNIITEYFSKNS